MGGRSLTTEREASLVATFPAALPLTQGYYYSFSHAELLGEFRHENLSLATPLGSQGYLGLSTTALIATEFEFARDIDERPVTDISADDIALGLAYGRSVLNDRMSFGLRLDLLRSAITDVQAYGYAVSASALFFLAYDLRLALSLQNLSHGIRFRESGPLEPLPATLFLEVGKTLEESNWSYSAGFSHGNEGLLHFYGGVERRLGSYLLIRTGYGRNTADPELGPLAGFGAGFGLMYRQFSLDYGVRALGPLGRQHLFTLNYSHRSERRPEDERLVEKAEREFRAGDYAKAMHAARKALALNPSNWKAHALAQQSRSEIERLNQRSISIFFTGNTAGRLLPHSVSGHTQGGLARRASKLRELLSFYPNAVALDAGEMTGRHSSPQLAQVIYSAYAEMPYAALNTGFAEVAQGKTALQGAKLPFLNSQIFEVEKEWIPLHEKTFTFKSGLRLQAWGALNTEGLDPETVRNWNLTEANTAIQQRTQERTQGEPPPRVLMLNGTLQNARDIVAFNPNLVLIILSGPDIFTSPVEVGRTLIVPAEHSHIGHVSLLIDGEGRFASHLYRRIPLDESVESDPTVAALVHSAVLTFQDWEIPPDKNPYSSPFFTYLSLESGEEPGLHLYNLLRGSSRRLATPGLKPRLPRLNHGRGLIAFAGEAQNGTGELFLARFHADSLPRPLTRDGGTVEHIQWHEDRLYFLYRKNGEVDLFLTDPEGRELTNLTQGRFEKLSGFALDGNGRQLALQGEEEGRARIWVGDNRAVNFVPLAEEAAFGGPVEWAPDGRSLVYQAQALDDSRFEVQKVDLASGRKQAVTEKSRTHFFRFHPSGKTLLYTSGVNVRDVQEFTLKGELHRKVTHRKRMSWRSEDQVIPKIREGKAGFLVTLKEESGGRIIWVDAKTGEEITLMAGEGDYFLE